MTALQTMQHNSAELALPTHLAGIQVQSPLLPTNVSE